MNFEVFANAHPMGYVHLAYAVVVLLHAGYGLWIVKEWRRTKV